MAELIDILSPALVDCPSFIVDVAAVAGYVDVTLPGAKVELKNSFARKTFSRGDNFILMSMGFIIPECFTFARTVTVHPIVNLIPTGTSTDEFTYPNMPSYNYLPMENFEMAFGTYFKCSEAVSGAKTLNTENFVLNLRFMNMPKISMINVPAAYDTKTFHIVPFLKILHNVALT